jgi:hypothetical protein
MALALGLVVQIVGLDDAAHQGWRMTSSSLKRMKVMPWTSRRMSAAWTRPERL